MSTEFLKNHLIDIENGENFTLQGKIRTIQRREMFRQDLVIDKKLGTAHRTGRYLVFVKNYDNSVKAVDIEIRVLSYFGKRVLAVNKIRLGR